MDNLERAKRLKAMLSQIAPKNNIESIPVPKRASMQDGLESVPGLESIPEPDPVIQSGMRKMVEDRHEDMTADETGGLEAIIMPKLRPVVFVHGASYDSVGDSWERLNTEDARARIAPVFPKIGRIELPRDSAEFAEGTSWLLSSIAATQNLFAPIFMM